MPSALILGAGHNGLVCALYLARAGYHVTVLEEKAVPGGAARREKQLCGCMVSPGANHYGMLDRRIVEDFGLEQNVALIRPNPQAVIGLGNGESIALFDDVQRTKEEIERILPSDGKRFEEYVQDLDRAVEAYQKIIASAQTPSRVACRDYLNEQKAALGSLFIDGSLRQALAYYFSHPAIQAALGGTAFLYNFSPDDPGTAFTLVYTAQFRAGGKSGWGFYPGGMGALMEKMGGRLLELGGAIHFNQKVTTILIEKGRAIGVKCGDSIYEDFDIVVSSYPYERLTFENGAAASKPVIADGMCSKINLLLDGPIEFDLTNAEHARQARSGMFVFCPSLDYMTEGRQSALKRGYSENPYFEIVQPSITDTSLSCGQHKQASICCMFSIYSAFVHDRHLHDAWHMHLNDVFRREGIRIPEIISCEFLDPLNLEQKFGLAKGNVDHGNLSPENSFSNRAALPGRPYETAYDNVFLCGSSQFPGGLVSGVPGRRAGEFILSTSAGS